MFVTTLNLYNLIVIIHDNCFNPKDISYPAKMYHASDVPFIAESI